MNIVKLIAKKVQNFIISTLLFIGVLFLFIGIFMCFSLFALAYPIMSKDEAEKLKVNMDKMHYEITTKFL